MEFSMGIIQQFTITKEEYDTFINSDEWKNCRTEFLKDKSKICSNCGREDKKIHVDHIKPVSGFWGMRLNHDNLQLLCKTCNFTKGSIVDDSWQVPAIDKVITLLEQKQSSEIDKLMIKKYEKEWTTEYMFNKSPLATTSTNLKNFLSKKASEITPQRISVQQVYYQTSKHTQLIEELNKKRNRLNKEHYDATKGEIGKERLAIIKNKKTKYKEKRKLYDSKYCKNDSPSKFRVGTIVKDTKLGEGIVQQVWEDRIQVKFEIGDKWLMLSHEKLEIITY
jgi:hypothetical protein